MCCPRSLLAVPTQVVFELAVATRAGNAKGKKKKKQVVSQLSAALRVGPHVWVWGAQSKAARGAVVFKPKLTARNSPTDSMQTELVIADADVEQYVVQVKFVESKRPHRSYNVPVVVKGTRARALYETGARQPQRVVSRLQ